jgi:glucosamine--fructose-6-phosphate aminotransferase (isomerizing)
MDRLSSAARRRLERLAPDGPDLMGREIVEGPAAVDATLRRLDEERAGMEALLAGAARIVLVGTGASLAVARTAAPVWQALERANGVRHVRQVVVRESAASVLGSTDGDGFAPDDLVIAISQSGGSPETLAAVRRGRRAGAGVIGVTAREGSPLAEAATRAVVTPLGEELGAATKSELAALAAILGLAGVLPSGDEPRRHVRTALDDAIATWAERVPEAACLAAARHVWMLGMGPGTGLAHAAALLWHEKVHRPAVATSVSQFRHGPIEAAGPRDAVLLVEPFDPSPGLSLYLDMHRRELGLMRVPLVPVDATADRRSASARSLALPIALLVAMLRLQQLARGTAHAAGTYRQGFRVLRAVVHPAPIAD